MHIIGDKTSFPEIPEGEASPVFADKKEDSRGEDFFVDRVFALSTFLGSDTSEQKQKTILDLKAGRLDGLIALAERNKQDIARYKEEADRLRAELSERQDEFCITSRCEADQKASAQEISEILASFEKQQSLLESSQEAIAELMFRNETKGIQPNQIAAHQLLRAKGELFEDLGLQIRASELYTQASKSAQEAHDIASMYESYIKYLSLEPSERWKETVARSFLLAEDLRKMSAPPNPLFEDNPIPLNMMPDADPNFILYALNLELAAGLVSKHADFSDAIYKKIKSRLEKYIKQRIGESPKPEEAASLIRALEAMNGPHIIKAGAVSREEHSRKGVDNAYFERALKVQLAEELYKSVKGSDESLDESFASYLFNTHFVLNQSGGLPLDGVYNFINRAAKKYGNIPSVAKLTEQLKLKAPHLFNADGSLKERRDLADAKDGEKAADREASLHYFNPGSTAENIGIGGGGSIAGAIAGAKAGLLCGGAAWICSPVAASAGAVAGNIGADQLIFDINSDDIDPFIDQALKGGVELGRVDEDEARQHAIDGASDRMADTFMAGLLGPLAAKVKVKGSETLKWAGRVAASENRLAQGLAKRFAYNWKGFWGRGGEELVSKMKAVLHLESDNTGVQNIFIQSTGRRLSDFSSESLNQFLRSLSGKKLIGLSRALNAVRVYGIDVIKGLGVRIDAKALAKADAEMVLELFKRLKGIDIAGLSEKALQDTLSGLSGKLNGTMEKLWFSIRAARKYGLKAIEENGHVKSPFFDEFKEYRRAVYREVESRMSPWRSKLFSAKGAANKSQKWAALKHVFRREASNDVISAYKTLQTASAPANGADKVLLDRIFGVINKPLDWFESQVRGFFRIPLENSRYMGQTFVPETKEAVKIALRVKETSRFAWLRVKGFVQDEVEGAVKGAISGVRNVPEVKNPGKLRQAVKKIGLWCANLFGKISKPLNKHILTKEVERALGRWPLIPAVIDYAFYDPDDGFKSWDGKFDTAWGFWSFVFSSCYMSSVSMGNTTFGAVNAAFVKALTFITWMYKSDMDDSSEIDYKSLTGSHLEYLFLAPFNAMLSSGIHFLKGFAVGRTLASVPYARLLPSMTAFPWAFMPGSLFVKPVFEGAGRLLCAGYYSLIVGWGTGFVFGSKKLIDADPYYKFQRTIKNLLVGLHFQPLQYALGYLSGLGQFVVRWWGYAWEATILYYPTPIYLDKGRNIPKVTRLLAENSPEGREEIWKSFVEQNVSLDLLGVYDRIVMFGEDLTPTGFEWHAPRSLEWRFETRAIMKQWLPRLDGRMTEDEAAGGKVIRWGDDHIKALTETYRQQMNNNEAEWEDSLKYQKGMVVFGMIVKMYADKARKGEERFKPFLNLVREQPYKDYWKSIPTPVNASDLERKIKEVDEKEIDPGKIAKLLYDTNVLKKSGDF